MLHNICLLESTKALNLLDFCINFPGRRYCPAPGQDQERVEKLNSDTVAYINALDES